MTKTHQMIHLRIGLKALAMLDSVVRETQANRTLVMRCAIDLARAHRTEWVERIKATVEADLDAKYGTVEPKPTPTPPLRPGLVAPPFEPTISSPTEGPDF